ncbi:MAG: recombinase family protein, partial [Acetatifactor sp.]|nr:recombinase family protein [Acetatifactor sp.]
MKRYVIATYIRLSMEDLDMCSLEDKEESFSISNQRNYIRSFLDGKEEFKGAEIREFVDDGYSGTNFDRPAVKEMLNLCRNGEIDCIVVKDLSRFGRNYLEVGDYLEQIFPFLGIRFIGINDNFDSLKFAGQTGGMDITFKNFIYEMYSRDLSEKVKSGVTMCMKRGEYYAGCIIFGYEKTSDGKGMKVDEGAAAIVRRIFKEMAAGKDATAIALEFNQDEVPTRLKYKQAKGEQLNRSYPADVWDRNKIYSIVHNRVYTGDLVYRRQVRVKVGDKKKVRQPEEKWTVIPNHHEAIVSRELFKKANDNIRQGRIAEYDRSAVKRGIIFCGYCGNRMELHKTKKTYYLCKRKDMVEDVGCKELRIKQDTIFQAVWKGWQAHFSLFQETSVRELLVKQVEKLQKQANVLSERAERFPVKKLQLYERFRSGEIDQEVFRQEKEVLDQ